jgi:hypothetical protein
MILQTTELKKGTGSSSGPTDQSYPGNSIKCVLDSKKTLGQPLQTAWGDPTVRVVASTSFNFSWNTLWINQNLIRAWAGSLDGRTGGVESLFFSDESLLGLGVANRAPFAQIDAEYYVAYSIFQFWGIFNFIEPI